ncbi:hypothetical protein SHIRM173S_07073 [Streptomyces hirsutus]
MRRARLTVHVSTKLNRSHAVTGARALILPTLGRTERDLQGSGEQFVTVEDSMGMVHASRGRLEPASGQLLSDPAIVCRLARRVLGSGSKVPWEEFEKDYATIRDRIARVIPRLRGLQRARGEPLGLHAPPRPARPSSWQPMRRVPTHRRPPTSPPPPSPAPSPSATAPKDVCARVVAQRPRGAGRQRLRQTTSRCACRTTSTTSCATPTPPAPSASAKAPQSPTT